jgi:hypothetical protein
MAPTIEPISEPVFNLSDQELWVAVEVGVDDVVLVLSRVGVVMVGELVVEIST